MCSTWFVVHSRGDEAELPDRLISVDPSWPLVLVTRYQGLILTSLSRRSRVEGYHNLAESIYGTPAWNAL